MPKIPKKLEEVRKILVFQQWEDNEYNLDMDEIAKLFGISLSLTYDIIKELKANRQ